MRKIEMKDFKDRLVNQDRRMSFSERIYLPAILKGMGVTIGHFFRKPETLQYPDERPNLSPRFRGLQELQVDENGEEKCVACGLCARVCPSDAIQVEAAENEKGEKYAASYSINLGRCIFCGFCEEACPVQAIVLRRKFELADDSREKLIYNKEDLLNWTKGRGDDY